MSKKIMKERKLGERFVTKRNRLLEVQLESESTACSLCYYLAKKKCEKARCLRSQRADSVSVRFIDISDKLPISDKLLLDRGLYQP